MEETEIEAKKSRKSGKTKVRKTPFAPDDSGVFGLRGNPSSTSKATSADCRFCLIFGREEAVGSKRRLALTIKQFVPPFRKENYRAHLRTAHPAKWAEYQFLIPADREAFFNASVPFVSTLHPHAESSSSTTYQFDAAIVDVIIGDVLWHPDDVDGVPYARAMALFVRSDEGVYEVRITTRAQYSLIVKYVAIGLSLRQATLALSATKEETRCQSLGFVSELKTQQYVRTVCAVNLQLLANILRKVWSFSLALDGSTCLGTSYVDLRVRFCWRGQLYNLHALAAPFMGSHTGSAQYELVKKVFDVLSPHWQSQMISCTFDGARNMTGRVQGVVTRLQQTGVRGFYRVWCLLHQADILMQKVYEKLDSFEYWKVLVGVIGNLRRQQLLIGEMRAKCPLVSKVRWISMYDAARFLVEHRLAVEAHYATLPTSHSARASAPSVCWWLLNHVVSTVVGEISSVVQKLQGKMTLLSQQEAQLLELRTTLMRMVQMDVVEESAATELPDTNMLRLGKLQVSKDCVADFVQDTHIVCMEQFGESLSVADQNHLVDVIGGMLLQLVEGLGNVVATRDRKNDASDEPIPPVLPQDVVALTGREMSAMIISHMDRLLASASWTRERANQISTDHKQLQADHTCVAAIKESIRECTADTAFAAAWEMPAIAGRYNALVDFVGGLVSIFPNSSVVESDFSILKYEKDVYRSAMTDLTLQSILHCKQLETIAAIPMEPTS